MIDSLELLWLGFTQLWQISLLVVFVLLVNKTVARNRPHLAYVMWMLVLVKCLTPPVFSSHVGIFSQMQLAREVKTDTASTDLDFETSSLPGELFRKRFQWKKATANQRQTPVAKSSETAVDQPKLASSVQANPGQSRGSVIPWPWVLLGSWLVGGLGLALLVVTRAGLAVRRIFANEVEPSDDLKNLFAETSQQINVNGAVRLIVSRANIGPAVIGWLRPKIVIPQELCERLSREELRPILAHELSHIRRKDLSLGVLQLVVQAIWWFHPLVWLANKLISQEIERCCDEEVIARTTVTPIAYARGMIRVLECKNNLVTPVAFPGVRPIELTKKRLERVMNLRHGCQKRTPISYWILIVICALAVLPGAAIAVSAQQREEGTSSKTETVDSGQLNLQEELADDWVTREYDLSQLVEQVKEQHDVTDKGAKAEVVQRIQMLAKNVSRELSEVVSTGPKPVATLSSPADAVTEPYRAAWKGETGIRVVKANQEFQKAYQAAVDFANEHPVKQYAIRISAYSCDQLTIKEFAKTKAEALRFDDHEVEEGFVYRLNKSQHEVVKSQLKASQERAASELMNCPSLATVSGTIGTIFTGSERPFVTRFEGRQPIVEFVQSGLEMGMKVVPGKSGSGQLEYTIVSSHIDGVETETLPGDMVIQVPDISKERVSGNADFSSSDVFLIGGLKDLSEKRFKRSWVFLMQVDEIQAPVLLTRKKVERLPVLQPQPGPALYPAPPKMPVEPKEAFLTRKYDMGWLNFDEEQTKFIKQEIPKSLDPEHDFLSMNLENRIKYFVKYMVKSCHNNVMKSWVENGGHGKAIVTDGDQLEVFQTLDNHRRIEMALIETRMMLTTRHHLQLKTFEVAESLIESIFSADTEDQFVLNRDELNYFEKALEFSSDANALADEVQLKLMGDTMRTVGLAELVGDSAGGPDSAFQVNPSWNAKIAPDEFATLLDLTFAEKGDLDFVYRRRTESSKEVLIDHVGTNYVMQYSGLSGKMIEKTDAEIEPDGYKLRLEIPKRNSCVVDVTDYVSRSITPGHRVLLIVNAETDVDVGLVARAMALQELLPPEPVQYFSADLASPVVAPQRK